MPGPVARVTIVGDKEFEADLLKLDAAARAKLFTEAIFMGAAIVRDWARFNIASKLNRHSTGKLASHVRVVKERDAARVTVYGLPYANIHEFGGWVVAKNWFAKNGSGPWLIWKRWDTGQWVMKKRVYIPPRPYMRPAVDEHKSEIDYAIRYHLIKILRSTVGK